jgi:nucleotide-binding universal stress UspA family protein
VTIERRIDMFKADKILCPIDYSDRSFKALEVAADLAVHFGCELRLVHVVQEYPAYATATHAGVGFSADQFRKHMTEQSEEAMRSALKRVPKKISTSNTIRYGDPAGEILAEATEQKVDFLVIASHGWSMFDELFFGSVAEKLLKHSRLPVFVVPTRRR